MKNNKSGIVKAPNLYDLEDKKILEEAGTMDRVIAVMEANRKLPKDAKFGCKIILGTKGKTNG